MFHHLIEYFASGMQQPMTIDNVIQTVFYGRYLSNLMFFLFRLRFIAAVKLFVTELSTLFTEYISEITYMILDDPRFVLQFLLSSSSSLVDMSIPLRNASRFIRCRSADLIASIEPRNAIFKASVISVR